MNLRWLAGFLPSVVKKITMFLLENFDFGRQGLQRHLDWCGHRFASWRFLEVFEDDDDEFSWVGGRNHVPVGINKFSSAISGIISSCQVVQDCCP